MDHCFFKKKDYNSTSKYFFSQTDLKSGCANFQIVVNNGYYYINYEEEMQRKIHITSLNKLQKHANTPVTL